MTPPTEPEHPTPTRPITNNSPVPDAVGHIAPDCGDLDPTAARKALVVARENTAEFRREYVSDETPIPPWASGVKPLRGLRPIETDRDTHCPTDDLIDIAADFETMSLSEQTTGPGFDALPSDVDYDKQSRHYANSTIRARLQAMLHMPHPTHEWPPYLLHHSFQGPFQTLTREGWIEEIDGNFRAFSDKNTSNSLVRVDPVAYKLCLEKIATRSTFPCVPHGHTGVENLGNGVYTCAVDACPKVYPRSVAEKVMKGWV